jgi:pseudouridine-5'-phosphate glycosidase
MSDDLLRCSPRVAAALQNGRPVVALETTVVTHGLPAPDGVRTALLMEEAVRALGAEPATIGVLEGRVLVGMTHDELERLAATPRVAKLNLSNLASCLATAAAGSTTVAATLAVAHRAGIRVFATGGIGGVHRHAELSGDVSADLVALARYPLAVVCAGAKAVLDLPRTVEMLETLGVPILGYATDAFPAFYRRSSGLPVDARYDDVPTLARAVRMHARLGLSTGVVVANPVPEADQLPEDAYERALQGAQEQADRAGVRGRAVTPFLLEHLRQATAGTSVAVNRALLLNNARLAAQLAAALEHEARSGR